ncbi:MAG TPA: hypothetical protein ENI23_17765 [bacterium]|nr:hypothetical protein [bacterium]
MKNKTIEGAPDKRKAEFEKLIKLPHEERKKIRDAELKGQGRMKIDGKEYETCPELDEAIEQGKQDVKEV